jgi:hypothetical protein
MKIKALILIAAVFLFSCEREDLFKFSEEYAGVNKLGISSFSFTTPPVAGHISGTSIYVTVPDGTSVTSLVPTIAHNGTSLIPDTGVAQDFTNPVDYTLYGEEGVFVIYTVTVTIAPPPGSSKEITGFTFATPTATGSIVGTDITVTVPIGTNLSSLRPTITHTGASISPASGTYQNFTSPVIYRVLAEDLSYSDYTVYVTEGLSSSKEITYFGFSTLGVSGSISGTTITVEVPSGTVVTGLMPTITHTGVGIDPTESMPMDFTLSVTYTVSAEDTTILEYIVTVNVLPPVLPTVQTTPIAGNLALTPKIAGNSALGGGDVTSEGGSPVTQKGLCWDTASNPEIGNSEFSISGTGPGIGSFEDVAMTGLTPNTVYYVRAYATSSAGTAYGDEISFNSGRPFGNPLHAGGLVFYNDGNGGGLVCSETEYDGAWSNVTGVEAFTSTAMGTGADNTAAIMLLPSSSGVAYIINSATIDIYTDWYLPSKDELNLIYLNLQGHTSFMSSAYWSSSEVDLENVHLQFLNTGMQTTGAKVGPYYARAVRNF